MLIGYARVSTIDQNPQLQLDALRDAGVKKVFVEKASGVKREGRPQLARVLHHLRKGDVLVVWKAERLARSTRDFCNILDDLRARGIGFTSLTQPFDTTNPAGRLFIHMLAAFAEFERENMLERINAGIKAAKAAGVHCGRTAALTEDQIYWARSKMYDEGVPAYRIAEQLKITRRTLHTAVGGIRRGKKRWFIEHGTREIARKANYDTAVLDDPEACPV